MEEFEEETIVIVTSDAVPASIDGEGKVANPVMPPEEIGKPVNPVMPPEGMGKPENPVMPPERGA